MLNENFTLFDKVIMHQKRLNYSWFKMGYLCQDSNGFIRLLKLIFEYLEFYPVNHLIILNRWRSNAYDKMVI